ncbi:BPS1 protein [Nymphaea thermarum]|nr:BPS1 protein [Nymphaea thermarum]
MSPSALLRSLSSRIAGKFSAPVAPWPVQSEFGRWLSDELDSLLQHPRGQFLGTAWLLDAMDVNLAAQKKSHELLARFKEGDATKTDSSFSCGSLEAIRSHLQDTIAMLDVCNDLRERLGVVSEYAHSLRIALHWLEGASGPSPAALARASAELERCLTIERRCSELSSCCSTLRRLGEKLIQDSTPSGRDSKAGFPAGSREPELHEALCASKSMALLTCGSLAIALSFKSRRGLPHMPDARAKPWCDALQELHRGMKSEIEGRRKKSGAAVMNELGEASGACRRLQEAISRQLEGRPRPQKGTGEEVEMRSVVETLEGLCEEMEMGVEFFAHRVDELYRLIISVRVCALDILPLA